jgi:tRNA pseudouridine55 synthase
MNAAAMPVPRPVERWRDVDGILLLDKPDGLTSNAALQKVRRLLGARKAGHTGSLDPLASGLLPICLGQATKACGQLLGSNKTYQVTVALGQRTATGDREGEVVEHAPVPELGEAAIRHAAAGFLGESEQVPPMYSALKHEGQRLYHLARQGLDVDRPARRIRIYRIELLGIEEGRPRFEIECSKGTYVRSLVEELARACGTVGHVASLRRVSLGPFMRPDMHTLAGLLEVAAQPEALDALLLPVDSALQELPAVQLDAAEQACILNGRAVFAAGPGSLRVRIYGVGGLFLGVGRMSEEGRRLAPERIMVSLPADGPQRA